jgi:TRAP-type transport system periplasmic protein
LEKSNLIGLGYWENGFRHLTTSIKQVKSVSDLKGLKIRTLESKVHLDTWKELGTNPVPMPFTELFSGLEGKVIDGQENPYPNIMHQKFYEVQKYMTNTGHVFTCSSVG